MSEINKPVDSPSTGPRTPEGKAIASMNALKHGFSAKNIIVMPGQEPDFQRLESELTAQVRPEGALEEILFHKLLREVWNMHRVELRQVAMAESGPAQRASSAPPIESEPRACIVDPLIDLDCEKEYDRLERYHARSLSSLHRSMRQLRNLQTTRFVQNLLPEPLGQGGLPALVKATEIIALAKRTHKQFHSLALNGLIAVSERSRNDFESKSKRNNTVQTLSHKDFLDTKLPDQEVA